MIKSIFKLNTQINYLHRRNKAFISANACKGINDFLKPIYKYTFKIRTGDNEYE